MLVIGLKPRQKILLKDSAGRMVAIKIFRRAARGDIAIGIDAPPEIQIFYGRNAEQKAKARNGKQRIHKAG